MPNVIDLSTPEKMEAFSNALSKAAFGDNFGKAINLGDIAEASDTLSGPKVCYETDHYHIVDHGADWKGRYTCRFVMKRRPEFCKSRVMELQSHICNSSAEVLLDSLKNAERFHMDNLPHCGGF
jgi:hypothetical protein